MTRFPTEPQEILQEYRLAEELGLISEGGLAAEERLGLFNSWRSGLEENERYGVSFGQDDISFVYHELALFRLCYAMEDRRIAQRHPFRTISNAEIQAYYAANRDLFTRYNGDSFPFEEVKDVIRKRIREEDYEKLLHRQQSGK